MTDHTLITTLYTLEPVLICVTKLSPSKIIILTEEDTAEKKAQAEQILEATFGKVIEIKKQLLLFMIL